MAYYLKIRRAGINQDDRMPLPSVGEALRQADQFIKAGARVDLYDLSSGKEELFKSHDQMVAEIEAQKGRS